MSKACLIVFISGSGSNLQAIMDAIQAGELEVEIVLVVSNRKAAYGLVRAQTAAIPTLYFPLKLYNDAGKSRDEYEADLAVQLAPYQPDLLVLAGWMHVFGANFLRHFPDRVINLHPALPGQFAGTYAIERAYEAFRRGEITHSGCMVHQTISEVDAGPVIAQTDVPFYPQDTLEDFTSRMHTAEHQLLVHAIQLMLRR